MAGITKEEKVKREEAKKKFQETFGDLIKVDDKNVVKVVSKLDNMTQTASPTTSKTPKQSAWLEKQVEDLNKKNEELEKQVIDYKNLLEAKGVNPNSASETDSDLKLKVKKIFEEMRANYEGRNANRTKYTQANILPMLEKFLKEFEFLRPKKKVK